MPYVLIIMFCLAGDDGCQKMQDDWHPRGYETLAECEERRRPITAIIVEHMPVTHLVSRCELAGKVA